MKKPWLKILLVLVLVALGTAYYVYSKLISPQVLASDASAVLVEIPSGSSFDEVSTILQKQGLVTDASAFNLLAEQMNYKRASMRSGRYTVKPGSSMIDMIRLLRNGQQTPSKLILTTEREPINVAAKAARFIEADSLSIITLLSNTAFLDSIGYTKESLMSLFIPNTYEVYWNMDARGFVDKMIKEHKRFWDKNERRAKAEKLNLDLNEVYTLASIVEKETLRNDEKKRMAGVYYNRLEINMPLQADPTAVFASRDFSTPRVTNYHLQVDSPYNTYMYAGLPPGPIAMSSISSIDAVLEHEDHKYLYFCAKGDGSGYHNFAKNLAAHNRNAQIYRQNLKKRGKR